MGDFVQVFIGAPDAQTAVSLSSADRIHVSIAAGFTGSGGGGGGGATNLSTTRTATTVTVTSDTGTDATIPAADGSNAGVMTAAMQTKLSGIETGADVTDADNVGAVLNAATAKTTPVDADTLPLSDSAAAGGLKKLSWANLKATAKAYFDTLYAAIVHVHAPSDITPIGHQKLIGRHGAGAGAGQEIGIGGGLEFNGANIRTSAISGDVSIAAGGGAATIANDAVTYAKMQNVSGASLLLGRGAGSGAGDVKEITLGTNLSMSGTTLNATGGGSVNWGAIGGTLSSQTDLQTALDGKVDENAAITGATKTKITYDAKGLVTAGADATTADIADSTNKRYVTDADLTKLSNTSGTNTGDQTITLTGDVTGSGTGSFAATIAADAVSYAKIQNVSTNNRLLGRATSGAGDIQEITIGSGLSLSGTTLSATGGGGGGDLTVLNVNNTQVQLSNTTSETALFSFNLPTDLAAGETLILELAGQYRNDVHTNPTWTPRIKLGGNTIMQRAATFGNSTTRSWLLRCVINIVSTSSQKVSIISHHVGAGPGDLANTLISGVAMHFAGYDTASEDTTTTKALEFTMQISAASAQSWIYCEMATLYRLSAP